MNYLYMILCGALGVTLYAIYKAHKVQKRYDNETFSSIAKITFTKELFALFFALGMVVVGTVFLHGLLRMNTDGKAIPYLPEKYAELFFYQLNVLMVLWGAFWALCGLNWFGVSEKIATDRASKIRKKFSSKD
jgi:hypothetical protein